MKARRPTPREMRQIFRIVIATFLICGALSMGSLVGVMATTLSPHRSSHIDPTTGKRVYEGNSHTAAIDPWSLLRNFSPLDRKVNILILGSDYNYIGAKRLDDRVTGVRTRTDTIMLASLDPTTHEVSLLSIPRDTRALLTGYHYDKINAAMTYGGVDLVKSTVTDLTGIPIDYYMALKVDGLIHMVDILGGIRMYVEKDMYYVDETQHLGINIHKGWKDHMNGEQAHQYIRFRKDELGDIGRVQRQQKFIRAVTDKLKQPQTLLKIPALLQHLNDNIETDLPPEMIGQLARFASSLKKQDIHMVMLPGTFQTIDGISYWHMNAYQARKVITELFPDSSLSTDHPADSSTEDDPSPLSHYRVSVWNASGNLRVGREVIRRLQEAGWPVYSVIKAPYDTPVTKYIAQTGKSELLPQLESAVNFPAGEQITASVGDISSDFTVLIGPDLAKALESSMTEEDWAEAEKRTVPHVAYHGRRYQAPENIVTRHQPRLSSAVAPQAPAQLPAQTHGRTSAQEPVKPEMQGILKDLDLKPELPTAHHERGRHLATPVPMAPDEVEIHNQVDPLHD